MERVYVALVAGGFAKNVSGKIDAAIGRHPKHGTKRCVRTDTDASQSKKQNVKSAVTHWKVGLFWIRISCLPEKATKGARRV